MEERPPNEVHDITEEKVDRMLKDGRISKEDKEKWLLIGISKTKTAQT